MDRITGFDSRDRDGAKRAQTNGARLLPRAAKRINEIWTAGPSGILIPAGRVTDISTRSRTDYSEIRTRAQQIEDLYAEASIRIPPNCSLGRLIRNGKDLWENWILDDAEKLTSEAFFLGIHLDRIADVVLPLTGEANRAKYLKDLLSGTLNFFQREHSKAKNIFWELEVWSRLRKRTNQLSLAEPPDVIVDFEDSRIGIACKKVYSERHVQNVLSQAVDQIESDFEFGIVAVNIDDLLPADAVLKLATSHAVSDKLHLHNEEFLQRHERHFRKYLSKGRLISAIVSTSVILNVLTERPRFNNAYQWTVWTIPGLADPYRGQVNRFYEVMMR